MMSSVRLSFSGLLVVLVLSASGCGDGADEERPAARQPSATVTEHVLTDCAATLTRTEVEVLAGTPVGEPRRGDALRSACRWDAVDGEAWVQVLDTESSVWSASLPELIDTVRELPGYANDPKLEKGIAMIENGGVLDPAEACDLFGRMVELQGMAPGSDMVVNYVPDQKSPQGINAQSCREGRYRSVLLVAPGLQPGPGLERRIIEALGALGR